MEKIGDRQFVAMCKMWGVDQAIEAAKRMGYICTKDQINVARKIEQGQLDRLMSALKHKGDYDVS